MTSCRGPVTSCSQEQALSCGKQEQMTTFSCRWPAVSFYFGCVLWVRSIFLLNAVHVFSNWWRYFPNLLVSFLRACVFLVLQCVGLSGTPYWPPLQTTARFSLIWQECWWPWAAFFFLFRSSSACHWKNSHFSHICCKSTLYVLETALCSQVSGLIVR